MKITIDIWMDGYKTAKEHKEACLEFIKNQLDFSGSSVSIVEVFEDDTFDWD